MAPTTDVCWSECEAARDQANFRGFLKRLGYYGVDETANPAYRMFLGR
jgi:hypothetical protein